MIVIFHFSLVKATMNAPRLCELRKDCFTALRFVTMYNEFSPMTSELVAYLAI